jgi:putative hydroxymethylpyrimidine transport system substrate-binding protein
MRRLAPLALLLLAAALLAGCGEKQETLQPSGSKRVELMLDFTPNADHAPIYAAQAAGYFREAGLDVKIRTPADPSAPIKQVAAGRVDLAISYEPEVFRARDKGLHVVSVGALVQGPLTSIISLPRAKIRRAADLKGKTVGTAGIDYQSAYLQSILGDAGVPSNSVKQRNVGFGLVPALLTKKVDAILGGFWNYEGVQLQLAKRKPRIIRVDKVGVPAYNELVLVANEDALDRDRSKLRAFIGALSRGARDLRRDPNRAVQGLLKADSSLNPKLQRASVKVTLPLFSAPKGKPYGWQSPGQWDAFGAWMKDNGLVSRGADTKHPFNNELLPGAGL